MTTNPTSDTSDSTDATEPDSTAMQAEYERAVADLDGELDIPDEATVYRCDHCGRPFTRGDFLALHRGLEHYHQLSEDEVEAYEEAYEDETAGLRHFKIVALGAMVLIYFGFLLTYLLVDLLAA